MSTEEELLKAGTHVMCLCHNAIPVETINCPYCHRFNSATTAKHCPLCGQLLVKKAKPKKGKVKKPVTDETDEDETDEE